MRLYNQAKFDCLTSSINIQRETQPNTVCLPSIQHSFRVSWKKINALYFSAFSRTNFVLGICTLFTCTKNLAFAHLYQITCTNFCTYQVTKIGSTFKKIACTKISAFVHLLVQKTRHFKNLAQKTWHLYIYLYKKLGIFCSRVRMPRYNGHLAKSLFFRAFYCTNHMSIFKPCTNFQVIGILLYKLLGNLHFIVQN